MDVRWLAYAGSGLVAVASLADVSWYRPAGTAPAARPAAAVPAPAVRPESYRALQDVQRRAQHLREYLREVPAPQTRARNPFRFDAARSASPSVLLDAPPPAAVDPPEPPARGDVVRLIGVIDRSPDGSDRTAVVAGFGDVHLVGVGDAVADRFRVVAIAPDAVQLEDLQSGNVIQLALSPGR
jgi:hypothetical protein